VTQAMELLVLAAVLAAVVVPALPAQAEAATGTRRVQVREPDL
jgi:hypothetical protein